MKTERGERFPKESDGMEVREAVRSAKAKCLAGEVLSKEEMVRLLGVHRWQIPPEKEGEKQL